MGAKKKKFTSQIEITEIVHQSFDKHSTVNYKWRKFRWKANVMKVKKQFCAKPSGLPKTSRKPRIASGITAFVKPIQQWRLSGNVQFLDQTSAKCTSADGTFHQAIYPVLIVAQCFGVMPVCNVTSKCPTGLSSTRKSLRFMFAVFVMMSCGLEAVFTITWTFGTHVEFGKMVILVFYVTNFMSFCCFMSLAKAWPTLMMRWHDVEKKLPQPVTKQQKLAMSVRVRRIAVIILTLSAVEHILSIISSVAVVLDCPRINNIIKAYYVHNFPQVFSFFSYSHLLGVYVKFIHVTSTFVWSYADLFIMIISCGLSSKFKQINERMLQDKGKVTMRAAVVSS